MLNMMFIRQEYHFLLPDPLEFELAAGPWVLEPELELELLAVVLELEF